MSAFLRPLVSRTTYRRWAHLILGGALLAPYLLLAQAFGAVLDTLGSPGALTWVVTVAVTLAALVVTGFIPAVRVVEGSGARELLGGPIAAQEVDRDRSTAARWRTSGWLLVHLLVGGLVSTLSLLLPTLAVVAFALPFAAVARPEGLLPESVAGALPGPWGPFAAALGVVVLVYLAAGAGQLLAALAPALLGPAPLARLAAAERRADQLAQRNRLARELHDSVGHALSVVTLQAHAANRVLDADPAFVGRALEAIAGSATAALEDLDHVLGLLRDEASTVPQPDLGDLDRLLGETRAGGVDVALARDGDLARVPGAVSREAYRIVQESLTNAVRHAGGAPVRVRLTVGREHLDIEVSNPLRGAAVIPRVGARRGLTGIHERVAVLRGQVTARCEDGSWRVRVHVPIGGSGAAP